MPGSLKLTLGGYEAELSVAPDGSVQLLIHLGLFGNQALVIPAAEWGEAVAYVAAAAKSR